MAQKEGKELQKMSKPCIAVVMGGPSAEHDVSLKSGKTITQQLDQSKYTVIPVTISRDRHWKIAEQEPCDAITAMEYIKSQNAVVFVALHGSYGEDGTLQALCEKFAVPYTGSSVGASLLAMDKVSAGEVYVGSGLLTPRTLSFTKEQNVDEVAARIRNDLSTPFVIKPSRQGSSVGVHIVREDAELETALSDAFLFDQIVLAQEFIDGKELSCGVLVDGDELRALPPTELRPVISDFFDYQAKYTPGGTEEITPPPDMDEGTIKEIQDVAIACHKALGCGSYSRTDVILREDDIYVIETNTLPGFTETSIFPQQANAAGISYGELLDTLIAAARV